jgi:hypothetical protein
MLDILLQNKSLNLNFETLLFLVLDARRMEVKIKGRVSHLEEIAFKIG